MMNGNVDGPTQSFQKFETIWFELETSNSNLEDSWYLIRVRQLYDSNQGHRKDTSFCNSDQEMIWFKSYIKRINHLEKIKLDSNHGLLWFN